MTTEQPISAPDPLAGNGIEQRDFGRHVLERARREAERYGDDPWILLRELVQNSRDAGARHIDFVAAVHAGPRPYDELSCVDDGSGMTRAEVRSYLLRLYASGKAPARQETRRDRARGPVGRFGVGFWSVLRFAPEIVRVESRSGEQGTAFEVDCRRYTLREVPCLLRRPGTRVTLLRASTGARFIDEAGERLSHWAGCVRGLDDDEPPRLSFNGEVRNAPFTPPPLIGERIAREGFDGVVGLGPRPSVRLYAHGLLLREAASLEELYPRRRSRVDLDAPGLYPIVQVNADGLEVLMNRREVVEDALLHALVSTCERRLARLRRRLLDRLAPLRLLDRVRLAGPRAAPLAMALVVAFSLGALRYTALDSRSPAPAPVGSSPAAPLPARPPVGSVDLTSGPRINQPSLTLDGGELWDIRVRAAPGSFHLVKLTTLSRFEGSAGLLAEPPRPSGTPPGGTRSPESVDVDMGTGGRAGVVALPLPSGHGVVPESVLVDDAPAAVLGGALGEPLVRLRGGERRVRYTTGPSAGLLPSPSLLEAPSAWPAAARALLDDIAPRSAAERVRAVEAFVKAHVRYTTSLEDAARFDRASGAFPERALSVAAGDCDVMNALFALLLRATGVPARVAVGLVVDDGVVAPDLHAWSEYWLDGGWHALDVSPPLPVLAPERAGARHGHGHTAHGDAVDRGLAASRSSATIPALPRPRDQEDGGIVVPALGGAIAGAGVLLALFALVRVGSRRRRQGDDEALGRLLWHWLQGPRGADPLHLRLRPFFPTLPRGRRLSLADLERRAARAAVLAAAPNDPLLRALRPGTVVVDASERGPRALLALLPEVIHLEELRPILQGQTHPLLYPVERALREVDDGVRVRLLAGAAGVREVELPLREGSLPPRYLLLGEQDPRWRRLLDDEDLPPRLRRFRLARLLLDQTTLYREQRDAILARLGREATS